MEEEEGKEKHPLLLVQSWLEKTNVGPILSPLTIPFHISSQSATSNRLNSSFLSNSSSINWNGSDSFFDEDEFEKYSISSLRQHISKLNPSHFYSLPSLPFNSSSSVDDDLHRVQSQSLTSPSIDFIPEINEEELSARQNKLPPTKSIPLLTKSTSTTILPPKVKKSTTQLLPIESGIKKQKTETLIEKDKEDEKEKEEKRKEIEKEQKMKEYEKGKEKKTEKGKGNQQEKEKGSPLDDLDSEKMVSPLKAVKSNNISQIPTHQPVETQKYSILSPEEHIIYLNLQKKIISQQKQVPTEGISPTDVQLYDYLTSFVTNEQQRWRECTTHSKLSDKSLIEKMKAVNPSIDTELGHYYDGKRNQVKEYPAHWNIRSVFDLRSIQVSSNDPILKHKQTVLQKGKCLHFQSPPNNSELPTNYRENQKENQIHWSKKIFPSVSRDKDVFKLLEKMKANFVISSSTLQSLVDPYEAFEIPVRIMNTTEGISQKVIFLDKPLLPKKITPKEKNTSYYKGAFKAQGLKSPSVTAPIDFDAKVDDKFKEKIFESENQTYNLWQFGNYSILIRCKIHGKIADNNRIQFRYVGLRTKMEYQLNEGLEEMTTQETSRSWIYTFIRPDAHLLLGRIDPQTGRIVEVEHKDMPSILPPGCLFKPEISSKFIFSVFQQLDQLPEGEYLISHKTNEFNVIIYQSVPGSATESKLVCDYDLHLAHKSTPLVDFETIPFCLVRWDATSHPNQIPYTFPLNRVATPKLTLLCFNFLQKGTCETENCGKIHSNLMQLSSTGLPFLKEKQQFGGRHCHFFASYGFCKQSNCKHPHIPKEMLQQQKKRKTGKKKRQNKKNIEDGLQDFESSGRYEETAVHSDLTFIANNL